MNLLELKMLFVAWFKNEYKNDYINYDLNRFERNIVPMLKLNNFSFPKQQAAANKDGYLIAFLNGVLNCKTLKLTPHGPEKMCKHALPIEFQARPGESLRNTATGNFLANISNHKAINLNVIRAVLFLIFTNDLKYQVGLYIHGPGGTGKTTLSNVLQFLHGPDATASTSLSSLNSRFGGSMLINKQLLIINELPYLKSGESPLLKSIIGEEMISVEEKFQAPTQITPKVFVIITSNTVWEIENQTTGFTRR